MSNEMDVYGQTEFDKEMIAFSKELDKLLFSYFYIDSANWDRAEQELIIIVKMLTQDESGDRNEEGNLKLLKFMSANQSEYFTAKVMKDRSKLKELSEKFVKENENEVMMTVVQKLTNMYNGFKTIEHSAGAKMSIDIEVEDTDMFHSDSRRII